MLPGPSGNELNLRASDGDGSAVAGWGLPEVNGSGAFLSGYDVQVSDGVVVKALDVRDPYAAVSSLSNGVT